LDFADFVVYLYCKLCAPSGAPVIGSTIRAERPAGARRFFFTKPPLENITMVATLDRLLALARKLHDAEVRSESEPIYVSLDLNEVRLLTRLAEDYIEQGETALYEREGKVFA
jgi:hypothetical protein